MIIHGCKILDNFKKGISDIKMNTLKTYPSEKECFTIIETHEMLPNIVEHSIQVKNVAIQIYDRLKDNTIVNRDILIASALLHDIAKTKSIIENVHHHDMLGGEILRHLGYFYIAEIVENHVVFRDFNENTQINEKDIIYYADKRVMHEKIVSLDQRIEDIAERYGHTEEHRKHILENIDFVLKVEAKIERYTTSSIKKLVGQI